MEFRIGTWNCFGMGQGLDAVTAARAPLAARLRDAAVLATCAAPDVMCVQELLSRDAQLFFDALALASSYRDHNRIHLASITMRGSGLGIGSRWSLAGTTLSRFAPPSVGWDRLARKGALYSRVVLEGGIQLDVLNVHLQAGPDAAAVAVRARQLACVKEWIAQLGSPARPFVVCGDFNVDGLRAARGAEYRRLAAALAGFVDLGADDDLPTFCPRGNTVAQRFYPEEEPGRLDYIFFRPAPGRRFEPTAVCRIFDQPLGAGGHASDHYGLTASFAEL